MSEKKDRSVAAQKLEDIENVFKALSHRSRRHVLLVLHYRGGTMTAGEIAQRFSCTWASTSRHLKLLEDAALVRVEKKGRERIYQLNRERLRDVAGGWLDLFTDDT